VGFPPLGVSWFVYACNVPVSPVRAAVVEQLATAVEAEVGRQTCPSQTSVQAVSVSLQRTITRSAVTGCSHDLAGTDAGPQPNTTTTTTTTQFILCCVVTRLIALEPVEHGIQLL